MSVIIGTADITQYITQGGISESAEPVKNDKSEVIGVHCVYSIKTLVPADIKDVIAGFACGGETVCTVDGTQITGYITGFTASVAVERFGAVYWNVDITVADKNLSEG